jgi:HAMP domain-containing protein
MSEQPEKQQKGIFISLRLKLLLSFSLLFTVLFAGSYYWFYTFATNKAIDRISEDLQDTMEGAAAEIDGDLLLRLAEEAEPRKDGYTNDPRYWEHVRWLATVEKIEPRAFVYTYIAGPVTGTVTFIGSASAVNKRIDGAEFLEYYEPQTRIAEGLKYQVLNTEPYSDTWGRWITGYTPIYNDEGEPVAGLGVDFRADYVFEVQEAIREGIIVAFVTTYMTLFLLVFMLSDWLTLNIISLTRVAERIGEGDYDQDLSELTESMFPDEVGTLASVIETMVGKVRQREETLKREVAELRIEIDESKRQQQVSEIVDTEFFQDLRAKARNMRSRVKKTDQEAQQEPDEA